MSKINKFNPLIQKIEEANIDAPSLLEEIWLEIFSHSKDNFFIKCPFHKDWKETKPSNHVHVNWTRFHCFSCWASWTIIKIIMKVKKCSVKEALNLCNIEITSELEQLVIESTKKDEKIINQEIDLFSQLDILSKSLNSTSTSIKKQNIELKVSSEKKEENKIEFIESLIQQSQNKENANYKIDESNFLMNPEELDKKIKEEIKNINELQKSGKYNNKGDNFLKLNFKQETIQNFGLIYNQKSDSICIPIKNKYWQYIWIYNKNLNEKYWQKYYSSFSFSKKENIFNSNVIDSSLELIIVEWPMNAIKLFDMWFKNVISLFWAEVSFEQIELIKQIKSWKLIIWFDQDEAWKKWCNKIYSKLKNYKKILSIKGENTKDAFDYSLSDIEIMIKNADILDLN